MASPKVGPRGHPTLTMAALRRECGHIVFVSAFNFEGQMTIAASLQKAEKYLGSSIDGEASQPLKDILQSVVDVLVEFCGGAAFTADMQLADYIEEATRHQLGRRSSALFLIRCLGVPGVIPEDDGSGIQRKFVSLVEKALPDIVDYTRMYEKKQTIDKFDVLRNVHDSCLVLLGVFKSLPTNPDDFISHKQDIFHAISNKFLKAYLNSYEFQDTSVAIRSILNGISELMEISDIKFGPRLHQLMDQVRDEVELVETRSDFLARSAYLPFLKTASEVLSLIDRQSSDRFKCVLRPRRTPPNVVERKYRLDVANQIVRVNIPLVNDGPGIAEDVTIQAISLSDIVELGGGRIDMGTVPPGEFALNFEMLVGEPCRTVELLIDISWRTARGTERQARTFETLLVAQDPNVDWDHLEASDPYSTEVAQGDEFVGRRKKVTALINRLRKQHMQSSYITGQKRVGKTSLALAVQDLLNSDPMTEVIYLEFGEYARKDADATVEALGNAVAKKLLVRVPADALPSNLDFQGSLAPLNEIAKILSECFPGRKYVLILDEFDEIHPDMYRYGPLAEAFFSNLRTLSAKKNIAVLLVGGENMPFIMGAQGDQLNKFVREPLDYFSRSVEWEEFCDLARQKGIVPLNWYESALNELFNYSNGHPYYTKLLCNRVFQNAIAERDTEVTVDEVRRAIPDLIETLDTNAFAHFWKDGIASGREESEVVELKRCRLLVAISRGLRGGHKITVQVVVENKGGVGLANSDIVPLLNDFCRRDILREKDGVYEFVLPLFQFWLVEKGITKLIADTLGDEMADAIQKAEDAAFVTGPEIAELVERWPLYRGRRVTTEDVRNWLSQRKSFREQRLLLKLLQNLRFVSEVEVREKLRVAHSVVKRHATAFTPETRSQRRFDVIVTYVDGPAKSGSRYADRYAEENLISTTCVLDPLNLPARIAEHEEKRHITVNGVIIIDDIAATGRTLVRNCNKFVEENRQFLNDRSVTTVVVALLATREGDQLIRSALHRSKGVDIDFRSCEIIEDRYFSFRSGNGIWASEEEGNQAKALVSEIGRTIYKDSPIGFGGLGLLVVFYDTCPNNTLPLLHSHGSTGWFPLFERPKN